MARIKDTTPTAILPKDMNLGDYISLFNMVDSLFSTTIVIQVEEESVTLWRPYGTTADFSHTRGVIPYVGIEIYKVPKSSSVKFVLLRKSELK